MSRLDMNKKKPSKATNDISNSDRASEILIGRSKVRVLLETLKFFFSLSMAVSFTDFTIHNLFIS